MNLLKINVTVLKDFLQIPPSWSIYDIRFNRGGDTLEFLVCGSPHPEEEITGIITREAFYKDVIAWKPVKR